MSEAPRFAVQVPLGAISGAESEPALAPARQFIRDLTEGQNVSSVFVVRERSRMSRRSGEDFLKLIVADCTGSIEAVAWEQVDELFELTEPGAIVHIEGPFSLHPRYGAKITLSKLRAALAEEYRAEDLTDASPIPIERLEAGLRELLATIQDPDVRALLDRFFAPASEHWQRFRVAPAAKYYHQAFVHGLLDHSLSVAQTVSAAASTFPGINRDVAVCGALLHDVGKMQAYNDDPMAIDLTDLGRLHGEIPLGYYLVRREIEEISGFDPETARAVLHIILSHHGTLEHGSPVVPATREATLVHAMDNLGGTLGSFDRIERELPDGAAWSKFDRGIGAAAYFGGAPRERF